MKLRVPTIVVVLLVVLVSFSGMSQSARAVPNESTQAGSLDTATSTAENATAPANGSQPSASGAMLTTVGPGLQDTVVDLGDHAYRLGWFADNFDDNINEVWNTDAGSWYLSGGVAHIYRMSAISAGSSWSDLRFAFSFTVESTGTSWILEAMFRSSADSCYELLIDDLNDEVFLKWYAGGLSSTIVTLPQTILENVWYSVSVTARGNDFEVYWNNALLWSGTDPSPPASPLAGNVAFQANSRASGTIGVDNVRVWNTDVGSVMTGVYVLYSATAMRTVHSLSSIYDGIDLLVRGSSDNVTWYDWHYIRAGAKSRTADADAYFISGDDVRTYNQFRVDLRSTDDTSPAVTQIVVVRGTAPPPDHPQLLGQVPWQYYVGGMVDAVSGNLVLKSTDMSLPGKGFTLQFTRVYNSLSSYSGPLGVGWTHAYNMYLTSVSGGVALTDAGGTVRTFEDIGNGLYMSPPGWGSLKLVRNADNTYTMFSKDGTQSSFSAAGKLTQIRDRNGNRLTLTYDAGSRLTKVSDDSGLYLMFAYDANGRITRVADSNLTVTARSPSSTSGSWTSPTYAYSSDDLYARTKTASATQDYSSYGFSGPSDSWITKVEVCVEAYTAGDDDLGVKISTNGGSTWSAEQIVNLPSSNPNGLTCLDFTSAKASWSWSDLADTSFRVEVRYVKVGGQASYDYLDWIPVRVSAASRSVSYAYDGSGNLVTVTDPLGHSELYAYSGILQRQVDRANRSLRFVKDANSRITQIYKGLYNPATGSIVWEFRAYLLQYYPANNLMQVRDASDNYSFIYYDDLGGRPTTISGAFTGCGVGCTGCDCGGGGNGVSVNLYYSWDGENNRVRTSVHDWTPTLYDWRGNVIGETDILGNYTENVWLNRNNETVFDSLLLQQKDKRGFVATNEYDWKGNLVKTTDALSFYQQNTYNASGFLVKTTDKRGFNTTNVYDAHGWLLSTTDPLGHATTYEYDAVGRRTKSTTTLGFVTRQAFNANDWVVSSVDPLGFVTRTDYNWRGDRIAVTDANGNRTLYVINVTCAKVERTIEPTGSVTTNAYDLLGRLRQVTDPNGNTWRYDYDVWGEKTKEVDPLGHETQYTYDSYGNVVDRIDPDGKEVQMIYDARDRLVRSQGTGPYTWTDYMDSPQYWTYTEAGGASFVAAASGGPSSEKYESEFLSQYVAFGPGGSGTDYGGAYSYTAWEQSDDIAVAYMVTAYSHDRNPTWDSMEAGLRLRLYNWNGVNYVNYSYWLASWYHQYDYKNPSDGNSIRINGKPPMNVWLTLDRNPTTDFGIDWMQVSRVQIELYVAAAGTVGDSFRIYFDDLTEDAYELASSAYDANGNIVYETASGFSRLQNYDALNRLSQMTFSYPAFSKTVQYTYDANGNRKTMVYPDGLTVTYVWNADNLLASEQIPGQTWTFTYDKDHRQTSAFDPSGLELNYTYDSASRLTDLKTKDGGTTIDKNSYTYDKVSNRKTKGQTNGTELSFDYTDDYNLNATTYEYGAKAYYVYDANDNRLWRNESGLSALYYYNDDGSIAERDLSYNGGPPILKDWYYYDGEGNRIRWTEWIDHRGTYTYNYVYDRQNRLIQILSGSYELTSYAYFSDGSRIRRSEYGTPTYYLYDFKDFNGYNDILETYDATGTVKTRFIPGPGIDEPLAIFSKDENPTGAWYYYHFDGQGSVTLLTRADKSIANQYAYDDFGGFRVRTEHIFDNDYAFTGREYDSAVDLTFYRARYYDAAIGRFLTRDPAGMANGPNMYLYAGNNPVSRADPSGQDFASCVRTYSGICGYVVAGICGLACGPFAWAFGGWPWGWAICWGFCLAVFSGVCYALVGAACSYSPGYQDPIAYLRAWFFGYACGALCAFLGLLRGWWGGLLSIIVCPAVCWAIGTRV